MGFLWHGSQLYVVNLESSVIINGLISNMTIVWGFLWDFYLIGIPLDAYNAIGCVLVVGSGFLISMT